MYNVTGTVSGVFVSPVADTLMAPERYWGRLPEPSEFLRLVDMLSPTHLRLLWLYDDPRGYFQAHSLPEPDYVAASRDVLITTAFPDLVDQEAAWRRAAQQLEELGLMGRLGGMGTGAGVWNRATTDLGRTFLHFISSPPAQESAPAT
jgi:hypothetical protein